MTESVRELVLNHFKLTPAQRDAARERQRDTAVTAGAGSGKTRTLVARYASHLADGLSPRRVVAITFTEKAAREMRSRVRDALEQLAQSASSVADGERWLTLGAQLDSARISTIHSLCAEILRAHPAEAGVDPRFEVIEEDLSAALRAQVVEDGLVTLVGLAQYAPLFQALGTGGLQDLLAYLLERRLDAQQAFDVQTDGNARVAQAITAALNSPALSEPVAQLRQIASATALQTTGDELAAMVNELLALWQGSEAALAAGDLVTCAASLFQARRECMRLNLGPRGGAVKQAVAAVRTAYDDLLDPIAGGSKTNDSPPSPESEALFAQLLPLVHSSFDLLHQAYQAVLRQRQGLDFDDLEIGAAQLLQRADVRTRWQGELDFLLVDEFQDTNARQREIVEALAGSPGRLFIVGDARQSIYRFRGADVTVFRAIQQRIEKQGGLVVDLDLTYRAHKPLLQTTGELLAGCMGTAPDPSRPYYVPFAPMIANRDQAPDGISDPYVEIVMGVGENTASARPVAARALALRLSELKSSGELRTWDDAALLFRASGAAAYYEDAFEELGIPYVTISGRFYDRPEVRDVLNILHALADPADDVAMAGLLRSPAFGLTDTALYQLRCQSYPPPSFWTALQGSLGMLSQGDRSQAVRALEIMRDVLPLVDKVPVAELLKAVIDVTDYRAILAIDDFAGGSGRLWRNLDKLVGDAQESGQVNVREFLQYLATVSDAGAREGEAALEAHGAVRLMTIHRAKGLEFPVVVLADAGRQPYRGRENVRLLPEYGVSFRLEPPPLLHRLATWEDKQQSGAEEQRLLYVALTRAKEKLIISGHAAPHRSGSPARPKGWLEDLCAAAGIQTQQLIDKNGSPLVLRTPAGYPIRAWCTLEEPSESVQERPSAKVVVGDAGGESLYAPLARPAPVITAEDEQTARTSWRVLGDARHVPADVIGQLVHKALALWLFPSDPALTAMLEAAALDAGLASPDERREAARRAAELVGRFREHPLCGEIESALERRHEVPYSRMSGDRAETGYMDVLYRTSGGWHVVDFKTDAIRSEAERVGLMEKYGSQARRYSLAVQSLLGQPATTRFCFLDDNGKVAIVTP